MCYLICKELSVDIKCVTNDSISSIKKFPLILEVKNLKYSGNVPRIVKFYHKYSQYYKTFIVKEILN